MRLFMSLLCAACLFVVPLCQLRAEKPQPDTSRGDKMIAAYFAAETEKLRDACLSDVESLEDWQAKRQELRGELLEMLGLDPMPQRTDLHATVTGKVEEEEFYVENIHFQSRPGLYVTGNVYVPQNLSGRAPAILYVCGHGRVKKDGVSYGNKTHYQHHGAWFARHGYVCLTIDTLQLGEIEGIHHGTYRYDNWWWLGRGYTPAGVEAFNCVRALDYLQSRDDVDGERLGVTGRSGGGAYSWWIAAIDERIKAAVPVAGITDLENHVVDGTVEGHCDCMFMVNTYQWDYPQVAALVAPRPLLISNTDRDGIFPLDGVVRTYEKVRRIYELYDAADKVALHMTAGPHQDTQELRIGAFRWLNHHLKDDDSLIEKPAEKFFEPEQLKVFAELPGDERNTSISETFVPVAAPESPQDETQWRAMREKWRELLAQKSFRGWPQQQIDLQMEEAFSVEREGIRFRAFDFTSQENIRLRLYVAQAAGLEKPQLTVLNVLDEQGWRGFLATMRGAFAEELNDEMQVDVDEAGFEQTKNMFANFKWAMAFAAPRGVGPTIWDQSEKKQTQHKRRFYLLGQSLDGMQVWDVRRAIQALRTVEGIDSAELWLQAERGAAGIALFASLFETNIERLDLYELPKSLRDGPYLLNAQRIVDMPQVVAMAAQNSRMVLYGDDASGWEYPQAVGERLGWGAKQLQFRQPPSGDSE